MMHSYLKSIGFKKISNDDLKSIFCEIINYPDVMEIVVDSEENQFVELRKEVSYKMGLALRGYYDELDRFVLDYYYPYVEGDTISTKAPVELVKQSDKESFQGVTEDLRLGMDLIFYIQDMMAILKSDQAGQDFVDFGGVKLSGLALDGKILLPAFSKVKCINDGKVEGDRDELLAAARDGDGEAMEKLTLHDMDTYAMISKRLENEDILSIVKSTFMPNGIECDKYTILGEIVGYKNYVNKLSMELVHIITVNTRGIILDVAINGTDLLGEPEVGRRFKGNIWLQGKVRQEFISSEKNYGMDY